ncbi:MAG: class I SAM-dependent methyltransferase [Bacteroidia bacterium]
MLQSATAPLSELIIQKIKQEGPIPFKDFMEHALYYPELGYYTSASEKIGTEGDYYTCPTFTKLFGQMLGKQLEEMWALLGKGEFTIVEYGAGTGRLCYDLLEYLKNNAEFYEKLRYCIIEKSGFMRGKEQDLLSEKVQWYGSITDIGTFSGCVLSNEVVDNFAVHLVEMQEELMEIFVDHEQDFKEVLKPASAELNDYIKQLNVKLEKGSRMEINLEATQWIKEIAGALGKGFVLTIDYGYLADELCYKRNGTLICYNQHKRNTSFYSYIGKQDITAHVNFSALKHWGEKQGLSCCGYTDQANFLRALGLAKHLRAIEENLRGKSLSEKEKFFLLHTLLIDMGSKFKVLIQQKGFEKVDLSGMMFSGMTEFRI